MDDVIQIQPTNLLLKDYGAMETIACAARILEDRHPEAARLIDMAVEIIMNDVEKASNILGIKFSREAISDFSYSKKELHSERMEFDTENA